jgi:hypothetical protein
MLKFKNFIKIQKNSQKTKFLKKSKNFKIIKNVKETIKEIPKTNNFSHFPDKI